jgi:hypothetical protein
VLFSRVVGLIAWYAMVQPTCLVFMVCLKGCPLLIAGWRCGSYRGVYQSLLLEYLAVYFIVAIIRFNPILRQWDSS